MNILKASAAALLVWVVCVAGAGTADAAFGTKVFLKDCAVLMGDLLGSGDTPSFQAGDFGTECDQYLLRGVSMVTESGEEYTSTIDADPAPGTELLRVTGFGPDDFVHGTIDVYIPYRSRCDRYRLNASDELTLLDARPCYGENYLNRLVDGFHGGGGTGVLHPADPACGGDSSIFQPDAPYSPGEPAAQSGTVTTEYCVDVSTSPATMRGTFVFTSATGSTLKGRHEGVADADSFDLTYTVERGTGQFRYATGTIHSTSTYRFVGDTVLDFEGSLVGSLVEAHLWGRATSIVEGDSGEATMLFKVRLSAVRAVPVTVRFSINDGTATNASDYTSKHGTLTFAPGESSKFVSVAVRGDTHAENDETLVLRLTDSPNARITVPAITGTILDDD